MYETFYGLSERPFGVIAQPKRYFPGLVIERARQTLTRCIERAEGVGLLTGPAGTGKSLLCQILAEQFRGQLKVALLASGPLCTRRALLQAILFELGLPYRDMEEGDLRLSLIDHLAPRSNANETAVSGLLLIVDEAHTMPLRLLEELRLITNLVRNGQPRVRLILVGGPQLEERFASPKLESFNQRIAARCYLESLDREQTINYVRYQIEQLQGDPDAIFTADALDAIYHATDGIPRLVNQVCDHALLLAFAGGAGQLNASGIEEAWSDLQQLPTPWNASRGAPAAEQGGGVIEFGSFDDELTEDLPAAVPFRNSVAAQAQQNVGPLERLQQIRAHLSEIDGPLAAEIDDDFQPAGSIGPEIELTLQPSTNPFHEAFDEEEVVIDRYASLAADALANRPLVHSAEGRELGALLAPFAIDPMPQVAFGKTTWPGGVVTPSFNPNPEPPREPKTDAGPGIGQPGPTSFAVTLPKPDLPPIAGLPEGDTARAAPHFVDQVVASPIAPRLDKAIDDDLIVIEDPPEQTVAATPPRARRKEYRQLFAQLRRG